MATTTAKTCTRCGEPRDRGKAECRACHYARSKAWIEANRERHREHNRASYQRHQAERILRHRQWEAENPQRDRELREAALARRTPASIAERSARRRARIRENGYESVDFDAILTRDESTCHLCGEPVAREDVHFDHVVPLARGGRHSADNIKVAHARCNLKKGAR